METLTLKRWLLIMFTVAGFGLAQVVFGQSVVLNPGFESSTSSWQFYSNGLAMFATDATGAGSLHAGHVTISRVGSNVQLYQTGFPIEPNTQYVLTFKAYSNTGHDLSVSLIKHTSPYSNYGLLEQYFDLTTSWNTYSVQFTTAGFSGTTIDARLRFWIAPYNAANDQYFLDDVILTTVGSPISAPTITTQPGNQTVAVGQIATFTMSASGTAPLLYQWKKNNAILRGATNPSYTTSSTSLLDNNSIFQCIVSNSVGSAMTNQAILTVTDIDDVPPQITSYPSNQTIPVGQSATYEVSASSSSPLTYQWQKNNANIRGATGALYATPSVALSDNGSTFRCLLSNIAGTATSNAATLTVTAAQVSFASDDFSAATINTLLWTIINPGTLSTIDVTGTRTTDALLRFQVPASSHDVWTGGNFAPRLMQACGNADFTAEVKFQSTLTTAYQMQGMIVEQDADNYLRFDFLRTPLGLYAYSASLSGGNPTQRINAGIASANPLWLRVNRTGNIWTMSYSINGAAFTTAGTYSQTLTAARIGPYAGNAGSPAPATTVTVDYFFNTASPINPEDPTLIPPGITTQPAHQTVNEGTTATFIVAAAGSTPIAYQWQRNNVDMGGATNTSYTTPTTVFADSGSAFRCIVSNAAGTVTSNNAILSVSRVAPSITQQPANQTVSAGQTATFSVSGAGSPTLTYQWQKNNASIGGATNPSYTTPATVEADSGATFHCIVSNAAGNVTSSNAILSVNRVPPSITQQPANQTVVAGQTATFSVAAAGSPTLSYQWQRNNANVGGATNPSYTTSATVQADNGAAFTCIVNNTAGTVTSNPALLSVTSNPAIFTSDDFSAAAINATLWTIVNPAQASAIDVTGTGTTDALLRFQVPANSHDVWTGGNFAPRLMQACNNVDFTAEVKFQSTLSSAYQMQGMIIEQDANNYLRFDFLSALSGLAAYSASFSGGNPTQRINTIIPNSNPMWLRVNRTGNSWTMLYSTNGTTFTTAGTYIQALTVARIGPYAGNVGSPAPATTVLVDYFFNAASPIIPEDPTILVAPTITTQPSNQTVQSGQTATFTVVASGSATLGYQWQKNVASISGATNTTYTTPAVTSGDNGSVFRCIVSNSLGSATSNAATLTVQSGPTSYPQWTHLSSTTGDLPVPNGGTEQTATLVLDVDHDGVNDFVIAERTAAPSVVWFRRTSSGWTKYVIDNTNLTIEAGGAFADIDGDGDLDIVFGGDSQSNQMWWWENPYPNYDPNTPWVRHLIKNSGGLQHHDELFGDFKGDGHTELVFWNQGANTLYMAPIPASPRNDTPWPLTPVYTYSGSIHEGLAKIDIDGDGILDIVGGGNWYKYNSNGTFTANVIDNSMIFTRASAGQLKPGSRPQVVFQAGDWDGPLTWYEWSGSSWVAHQLLPTVVHGHSLQVADINGDGKQDIFSAEMRLDGGNATAKMRIFYGDGQGNFTLNEVASGFGNHESRVADLDGDGNLDILDKPYNWNTPRIDVWINRPRVTVLTLDSWQRHVIDANRPWRSIFITSADIDGDGKKDIVTGGWWYKNPGLAGGVWTRNTVGAPMNQMACVYDFDGDGRPDILGTQGIGSETNTSFAWARNNGNGTLTAFTNVQGSSVGTFLQGIAVARFSSNGPLEVALAWNGGTGGTQMLTVPSNPSLGAWTLRQASTTSQGQGLDAKDIDRDGDPDLVLGTMWLRNDNPGWTPFTLNPSSGMPDRNKLVDMNHDGRLDVVVGYEVINAPGKLAWYEQPLVPTGTWVEHIISMSVVGPMSLDVGDLDNDGDLDVVVGEHNYANPSTARLIIFENTDGVGGAWTQHVVSTGDEHHDGAQLVDIDNDGDLDIISIGWTNSEVLLYENKAKDPVSVNPYSLAGSAEIPKPHVATAPTEFTLHQNLPNPFNPSTTIQFELPQASRVILKVFNMLGQEMATLVNEEKPAGVHQAVWNAQNVPSGVYICRIEAGKHVSVIKMILMK